MKSADCHLGDHDACTAYGCTCRCHETSDTAASADNRGVQASRDDTIPRHNPG